MDNDKKQSRLINITGAPGGCNYQVKKLLPRHYRILELRLAGLSNKAIAESVDCTPQTVGIVSRSPLFRAEYQRRLASQTQNRVVEEADAFASLARSTLEQNAERAAQTQVDLLESEDDSVRLRSSGSILDRVLGKPEGTQASDGPSIKVEIQTKDAQLLILALRESKEIPHAQGHAEESPESYCSSEGSATGSEPCDVYQDPGSGPGE